MLSYCRLNADKARARMARLGRTQHELAEACEMDVRTLQRWLAGQGVSVARAERVAAALGVGTAEVFDGLTPGHEGLATTRVRSVIRLFSEPENAFAQALRLVLDHYGETLSGVSFDAHPLRGYVSRVRLSIEHGHGFQRFRVGHVQGDLSLVLRAQLGRRLSIALGEVRVRAGEVVLLERFCSRSMRARLTDDGAFDVFVWVGSDRPELVFNSDRDVTVQHDPLRCSAFDASLPEHVSAVCLRPGPSHLREAGLPPGFDRVVGERLGRVDVPVHEF